MKKYFIFLFLLSFAALNGLAYPPVERLSRQVQQALAQKQEDALFAAARTSVVQIKVQWLGQTGQKASRPCKGVLINKGRRVVTHGNCLALPQALQGEGTLQSVTLHFYDGQTVQYEKEPPLQAGKFAYWDLPAMQFKNIVPAELVVTPGLSAAEQLTNDGKQTVQILKQNFIFCGRNNYRFCTMKDGSDEFELRDVLRERQIGEPVFVGPRVVALNGVGAAETHEWGRTFLQPPLFTIFANENGGALLVE